MKNGLKVAQMFSSLSDDNLDKNALSHCRLFHIIQEHSHINLQMAMSTFLHNFWSLVLPHNYTMVCVLQNVLGQKCHSLP